MIRDNTSVSHQGAGYREDTTRYVLNYRHLGSCLPPLATGTAQSPAGSLASPGCAAPVQLAESVCLMELQVASRVLRRSDQNVAASRCAPASQHLQILLARFPFTTLYTSTEWFSLASQFASI